MTALRVLLKEMRKPSHIVAVVAMICAIIFALAIHFKLLQVAKERLPLYYLQQPWSGFVVIILHLITCSVGGACRICAVCHEIADANGQCMVHD